MSEIEKRVRSQASKSVMALNPGFFGWSSYEAYLKAHNIEKPLISSPGLKLGHSCIRFTIPGQPMGKPRMTQSDKWNKRGCVVRYREWSDKARASIPVGTDISACTIIEVKMFLSFPKSYSARKRVDLKGLPHNQKPDIDNILKGLFDAIFKDDCKIWKVSAEKLWDDGSGSKVEVVLRNSLA